MSYNRARLKSSLPRPTIGAPSRANGRPEPEEETQPPAPMRPPTQAERSALIRERIATRTVTSKRRLQRTGTPLRVLQQPIQAGMRKVFDLRRLLLVLGVTAIVLLLPTPAGLSIDGHKALALFAFSGLILALEPAPLPIVALLVPIVQIALGVDDAGGAFEPFGTPVVFLILGSLFLAEALRKHGLTRRLALHAIVSSRGRFGPLLLALMAITGGLSMFVLNTATAAVLIPVAITIAQQVPRPEDGRKALAVLILAIGYSSSIGAIATIMGSGENAIASGLLGQLYGFGFVDWMKYGLPVALLLIPLVWLLLPRLFALPALTIDVEPARREIERLGRLSGPEREIIAVLLVSISLWVAGGYIELLLKLPATLLSSAVIAIGAVAVLSVEKIVDWSDLKGVNWGVFFVIGAGLTLGDALEKTGASPWFANLVAPSLDGLPFFGVLAALILLAFCITQFMNNVPLGAILAPVLITLGQASGIDPVRLVIPTIFAVALAFALPSGSARMILIAVTGVVNRQEMLRTGVIVGLACSGIIFMFFLMLSQLGMI
ncbi:MAG: DASS family sodium-coupled anion symporter [Caldilineaceae bacterium SB0661_bin_32]|uniref:Sodium-dependent dicarboxylate transporter SdcS n=1 Tax=Caldilineaceae bacterium SB0661_bin_32 TaxID=2605255 RepID=A0A6B1D6W3_9CHLR|nr:DASS family sodium-coupled anion symporter [Caldilineaceae bacterium SB0661_bin_32]